MILPQALEDGLVLRWATEADAEAIAAFNIQQHSNDPVNEPELWLGDWVRALMLGEHPTTRASDFTVVVDGDGQVVSSACLIGNRGMVEGIEVGCGQPELIATDPAYRRRGLVRRQMEALHAKSAARGDLMQAITGIPWYYRQFGYEMTLELHGSRPFFLTPQPANQGQEETYRLRTAVSDDLPTIHALYEIECQRGVVAAARSLDFWQYAAFVVRRDFPMAFNLRLVETQAGEVAGYVAVQQVGEQFSVREIGVVAGHSLRDIGLCVVRALQQEAARLNVAREKPIKQINFMLGSSHPLYAALDQQLGTGRPPYAWYVRVADVAAFLRHIAPVFTPRLAASVMAGYSGKLRLSFYRRHLEMVFERGQLRTVGAYTPDDYFDCDAFFPEQTFLHLLLGHRSLAEVRHMWADCYTRKEETAVLLDALFPKRPSCIRSLG
ncbi:MAG: GNAT family N-acetyltransferase [Anaerolineales bacterium]|nr:GNAT family N-acetyltransferase [Anaerolineales bacterium]